MSSFVISSHSGKKLVEGQLWAEVTAVTIWGHMKALLVCAESYETIFIWVSYFILLLFCTRSDEGSDFWTHLKMCVVIYWRVELLSGEMGL